MQIRERGKQILCIRTEYVADKKRTYGRTVARQDKGLSTVSEEVRAVLDAEEVEQLQAWLDERRQQRKRDYHHATFIMLPQALKDASAALDDDSVRDGLSTDQIDDLWRAHEQLSKALKKHGFKKPEKSAVAGSKKRKEEQPGLFHD